jgi:hypothetical protein
VAIAASESRLSGFLAFSDAGGPLLEVGVLSLGDADAVFAIFFFSRAAFFLACTAGNVCVPKISLSIPFFLTTASLNPPRCGEPDLSLCFCSLLGFHLDLRFRFFFVCSGHFFLSAFDNEVSVAFDNTVSVGFDGSLADGANVCEATVSTGAELSHGAPFPESILHSGAFEVCTNDDTGVEDAFFCCEDFLLCENWFFFRSLFALSNFCHFFLFLFFLVLPVSLVLLFIVVVPWPSLVEDILGDCSSDDGAPRIEDLEGPVFEEVWKSLALASISSSDSVTATDQ